MTFLELGSPGKLSQRRCELKPRLAQNTITRASRLGATGVGLAANPARFILPAAAAASAGSAGHARIVV